MGLRFYASIVTGALAEVMTLAGLWMWSDMEIGGMIFWSLFGYFCGMAAVMFITEPPKQKRKRWEPQIYKLEETSAHLIEEELIEECV